GIALKIPDKLLILPALLERRESDLLVELHRLCHLANMQRIGSQFVERHRRFYLSFVCQSLEARITCHDAAVVRMVGWSAFSRGCLWQRQIRVIVRRKRSLHYATPSDKLR